MKPASTRAALRVLAVVVVLAATVATLRAYLALAGSWAALFWSPILFAMVGVALVGVMARHWKPALFTAIAWAALEGIALGILALTDAALPMLLGALFVPWVVATYVAATRLPEPSDPSQPRLW